MTKPIKAYAVFQHGSLEKHEGRLMIFGTAEQGWEWINHNVFALDFEHAKKYGWRVAEIEIKEIEK